MKKSGRKIVIAVCVSLCIGVIFRYGYTHFFNKDRNQFVEIDAMAGNQVGVSIPAVEYLNGEGENKNQYANNKGSRIVYEDGYCYYASQLDNYYLYRAKEDGSDAVCLVKIHSGRLNAIQHGIKGWYLCPEGK